VPARDAAHDFLQILIDVFISINFNNRIFISAHFSRMRPDLFRLLIKIQEIIISFGKFIEPSSTARSEFS
jgi:hypothetical protein